MANYSYGNEQDWNKWTDSLGVGNRTFANAGTSGLAMTRASGVDDLYKQLGLDASTEALKNPYAQNLTPKQVTGDLGSKSWWGEAADWLGDDNNARLTNTIAGGVGLAAKLIGDKQVYDYNSRKMDLLDRQIDNVDYEMNRRQGFSAAMAKNAQNQTAVG
jgi:hypothetical protein